MKACNNCKALWEDDYEGQCTECGAPMGGWEKTARDLSAATPAEMDSHLRQTARAADRENALGQRFAAAHARKQGRVDNVQVPESTLEVAAGYAPDIVTEILEAARGKA